MGNNIDQILHLSVPVVVRLGERQMALADVIKLVPGSIIELPKGAEDELDLMINNHQIGWGVAVKVGENFGLKINHLGDLTSRIYAMAQEQAAAAQESTAETPEISTDDAAAMAEKMLAGQV